MGKWGCWYGLGIEVEARPFAKSTLQLFRAQLILHDRVRAVFQRSLQFARQTGCLKGRRMKVAVDTTYILGRGAVNLDTYNLLADGIVQWSGHWPNMGPGPKPASSR